MIYDEQEKIILEAFFDGLRPIPRLTVSEWADSYRMLTSQSSAEPGQYRTARMPYLRKVMDVMSKTSPYQEVVFCKGSQVGGTDAMNNFIGYTIHIDPGPMLLIMPTEAAVNKNSRTRIKPMIEGTAVLSERIGKAGDRSSVNTVTEKEFPGGVLMMVASNSPVGLSSTPVGKILMDEVDRFPLSAGDEGSPVELARARARTFQNKKIIYVSTPTLEGESVIWKEFLDGDMEYYHVPCIHCGDLFVITWSCITWDEGKPETTRCACPNCGGLHEERHKTKMFPEKDHSKDGRAEWIATGVSSNPKKISLHLAGLYSPFGFYSWEDAVRDYLKAEGDETLMQTFINTVLGQTYKVTAEVPDEGALYDRREDYGMLGSKNIQVPAGVYFLTMGVDTQNDRLEYTVRGWGKHRESWIIEYKVLVGDTADQPVWEELGKCVNGEYLCHDWSYMKIRQVAIDSGGHRTQKVYDFAKKQGYAKVIPVRGLPQRNTGIMVHTPKTTTITKAGKKIGSAKVWGVDTYMLKEELYSNLRLTSKESGYPPGYIHFSTELERYYFKMLTAEELRLQKNAKGYDEWQWVKVFERNEALDVTCYARAAAWVVGMDRFNDAAWDKIRKTYVRTAEETVNPLPKKPNTAPAKKPADKGWFDKKR